MKGSKPLKYWDSCIFIAWLKNEPNDQSVIDGMEETVRQVDSGKIRLLTSVVTLTEILEGHMTPDQFKQFQDFFKRKNVQMANHDQRIGTLSQEIRNYHLQQNVKLSTPDCLHLATAIIHNANEFHTLDGSGKKKTGKLIPLSGNVAGKYKLKICEPYAAQGSLLTQLPS